MEGKKKKRLVIATDSFIPRKDGVVRFLTEIIPRLKDDYDITVICPEMPGEYRGYPYAEVIRFPIIKILFGDIYFSWFNYTEIRKIIAGADMVFVQSIAPIGLSAIRAAHRLRKPVACYIHSVDWEITTKAVKRFKWLANAVSKKIARSAYRKADLLFVPGEEIALKLKKNGIEVKKAVVSLGVDTMKFSPTDDKKKAKEAVGINPGTAVVGFVSRIAREKDLMTLYRAFRRLEKQHENIKLLVVGSGIKEVEKEFSSNRNIILPGSIDDVVPYYRAMDVFVLPSLTETSSLATMEAMACGLPVVVTPVGMVKEYIKEKENGMLFPFGNSMILAMKIRRLLAEENLREKLGKNARETIMKRFNWEKTAAGIRKMLSSLN